ncbi:hypothetical protein COOONC_20851, partial [Cooperia oncophora]
LFWAGAIRLHQRLQRRGTGTQVDRTAALEGFRFPWPFPKQPSSFYNMMSYFTLGSVATVSKLLFIRVANELVVHNKERFMNIWMDKSRPLITISNHRSNMDDPLMWSKLILMNSIFVDIVLIVSIELYQLKSRFYNYTGNVQKYSTSPLHTWLHITYAHSLSY